jgi:hypothetical protein
MIFCAAGGCQRSMAADAATVNDANAVKTWGNAPLSKYAPRRARIKTGGM